MSWGSWPGQNVVFWQGVTRSPCYIHCGAALIVVFQARPTVVCSMWSCQYQSSALAVQDTLVWLFPCQIAKSNVRLQCPMSPQINVASQLYAGEHIPSVTDTQRRVWVGGTNNLNLPKIIANLVEGESSGLDFGTLPSWQCGHLLTDTSGWKMASGWA